MGRGVGIVAIPAKLKDGDIIRDRHSRIQPHEQAGNYLHAPQLYFYKARGTVPFSLPSTTPRPHTHAVIPHSHACR